MDFKSRKEFIVAVSFMTLLIAFSGWTQENIVAKKTSFPPKIDGKLTDECWKFMNVTMEAETGTLWMVYDEKGLYVAGVVDVKCLQESSKEEKSVWDIAHIELILMTEDGNWQLRIAAHPFIKQKQ